MQHNHRFYKGGRDMGRQDDFSASTVVPFDVTELARSTDTVNYITDLLSELQTIAMVSGLGNLSNDINAVILKYMTEAV